jgi:hypothetical protein
MSQGGDSFINRALRSSGAQPRNEEPETSKSNPDSELPSFMRRSVGR